jgi:hypothetical protein
LLKGQTVDSISRTDGTARVQDRAHGRNDAGAIRSRTRSRVRTRGKARLRFQGAVRVCVLGCDRDATIVQRGQLRAKRELIPCRSGRMGRER